MQHAVFEDHPMSVGPKRAVPIDLLAVVLLGGLATLALLGAPHAVAIRAALGLPFLLLGPGYALMSAIYGRQTRDTSISLMLTLALSIAAMVLIGLALDAAHIALTERAMALALLAVASVASLVAALRRGDASKTLSIAPSRTLRSPWMWSTIALVAVFAALLVALAQPLGDRTFAGYTQLSALRSGAVVNVIVKSAEHSRTSYRLEVRTASRPVIARALTLAPGQQSAQVLDTGASREQTIHIRLYLAVAPASVYRELTLRA